MDSQSFKAVSSSEDHKNKTSNPKALSAVPVANDVGREDHEVTLTHQLNDKENATDVGNHGSTNECRFQTVIQFLRQRRGLVLATIAPFLFSFQSLFVDVLTGTLDSFQVVLIHAPWYVMCCFLLLLYARVRPPKNCIHYAWLLGSGAAQSGSSCFLALALANMPVGDAVSILFTAAVQVVFYSRIILKEPIRLFDLLVALVALGGVVIIARPPFIFGTTNDNSDNDVTLQGIIFALAGSCSVAIMYVMNRKVSILGINSYFCMFSNGIMVCVTSGILTLILKIWRWPTMYEWLFAVLAGVVFVGSNFTVFYALKVEAATLVTVIGTTEIIYAFVWQIVFLHQLPFWTSYVGTVLIIVACVGTALKSKPQPSTSSSRLDATGIPSPLQNSNV